MASNWGGARNFSGNRMLPPERVAEVQRLLGMGLSAAVVCRRTGLGRTVVDKIKKGVHASMQKED